MSLPNRLHFAFHSVLLPGTEGYNHPYACSAERLRRIIAHLEHRGYTITSCRNAMEADPQKSIATLSFDDGYVDGYHVAFSILKEHEISATFGIIACTTRGKIPPNAKLNKALSLLGIKKVQAIFLEHLKNTTYEQLLETFTPQGPPFLTSPPPQRRLKVLFSCLLPLTLRQEMGNDLWNQCFPDEAEEEKCWEIYMIPGTLKYMEQAGMEVSPHSDTHPMLHNRGEEEIDDEIQFSIAELKGISGGTPPRNFIIPYGGTPSPHLAKVLRSYEKEIAVWGYIPNTPPWRELAAEESICTARYDHRLFEEVLGIEPLGI